MLANSKLISHLHNVFIYVQSWHLSQHFSFCLPPALSPSHLFALSKVKRKEKEGKARQTAEFNIVPLASVLPQWSEVVLGERVRYGACRERPAHPTTVSRYLIWQFQVFSCCFFFFIPRLFSHSGRNLTCVYIFIE